MQLSGWPHSGCLLAGIFLSFPTCSVQSPTSLQDLKDLISKGISGVSGLVHGHIISTVPTGYTAESYYPAPRGGWVAEWADSYAKAQLVVEKMTLAEKVNLTTGTGVYMVSFCSMSCTEIIKHLQHKLKKGNLGIIGAMHRKHWLSSPFRYSIFVSRRLGPRGRFHPKQHSISGGDQHRCNFQQGSHVCTWSGPGTGSQRKGCEYPPWTDGWTVGEEAERRKELGRLRCGSGFASYRWEPDDSGHTERRGHCYYQALHWE